MDTEPFDWESLEKEMVERDARMKERENQGLSDIYKYFDRINDKLYSFNNILIAGYFAIVAFSPNVSKLILVIPLINMVILIYLDYIMMEQGRFLSQVMSQPISKIKKYGKRQIHITQLSLLTIITTLIVTIIFLWILNDSVIKK